MLEEGVQLTLFDELFTTKNPEEMLLEKGLRHGSGFANGKKRINDYALTHPTIAQFAKFLKEEYGIGGYGSLDRGIPNMVHSENHDGKGIEFRGTDITGKSIEIIINWEKAAEIILDLVGRGEYL